jgi:hypothetical protein
MTMTNPHQYYVLYWTGVAHLVKDVGNDNQRDGTANLRRSLCGKAEGAWITWNMLESLEHQYRPPKCKVCTRIAEGKQGK